MNEELQSANGELQTMNDELRHRGTDLSSANTFLESVFSNLRSAVVVVDREMRVLVWNERAADLIRRRMVLQSSSRCALNRSATSDMSSR